MPFWKRKPEPPKPVDPRGHARVLIDEVLANCISAAHPADRRSTIAGLARDLESFAAALKLRAA